MKRVRSVLYVPGHRTELAAKAARSGADAVCLVLEDSVPRDLRDEARRAVAETIPQLRSAGLPTLVKVNPLDDGFASDLEAIAPADPDAVIVPRLRSPAEVAECDRIIGRAEERQPAAGASSIEMILMVETPEAVVLGYEMARASGRVSGIACGAAANGDLAGALRLRARADGLERLYVQSKVLVDARAAGIGLVLDGVWAAVKDLDGLQAEIDRARSLGYDAKFATHPIQVEAINAAFAPSEAEIRHSREVVRAFEEAERAGRAAIVVEGEMVDYAMVKTARETLELASLFEAEPPPK